MKTETMGDLLRDQEAWETMKRLTIALNVAGDLFCDRAMQRVGRELHNVMMDIANLEVEQCRAAKQLRER